MSTSTTEPKPTQTQTRAITRKHLVKLGAEPNCCELAAFVALFPDGADPIEEAYDRAAEAGLNLIWLAERLLPGPALAEYEKVIGQAWAEYQKVIGPALKAAYASCFWAAGSSEGGDR